MIILTDDGKLQNQISSPKFNKLKTYVVQVEDSISDNTLNQLINGVTLNDGRTKPAKAQIIVEPQWLWRRDPPIRERKNIPISWIKLSISESRNRQVRRMTAHTGFPKLRLIRTQISDWQLNNLPLGAYVTL